jgi:hypothetical protein
MKFALPFSKSFGAFVCCCAAFILHPCPQAVASTLAPGGSISLVGEPDPVTATTVFTTNVSWSYPSFPFAGTLTSSVLQNDASNPLGGLTFTYRLTLDSANLTQASQLTIGGFAGFLVDASYQSPVDGIAPTGAKRSGVFDLGQTIRFDFDTSGGLLPNENTALLVIQTDAANWSFTGASIQDHVAVSGVLTVAPSDALNPVPEPTTATLGLLGVLSTLCFRRKRQ